LISLIKKLLVTQILTQKSIQFRRPPNPKCPPKKVNFEENEIAVFEDAVIYKRGVWQFRLWLSNERNYACFSLITRN